MYVQVSGGNLGGPGTRETPDSTQVITVNDDTPPVITCPPNFSVQCEEDVQACVPGDATATDNCDDNVDIVVADLQDDEDGKGQGCNTSAGPMSFAWVVAILALALRRRQDLEPVIRLAKL